MAIQHGIWKVGEQPERLNSVSIESEDLLEQQIFKDISILNADWLLIGRQVKTEFDKFIDLLAIDANGSLIVIELKRGKTPRDVVAQALDYASWVVALEPEQIVEIFSRFVEKFNLKETSLDKTFQDKFDISLQDVELNESHQMLVVAAELDASTERIINYLNDYASVPINAVFFSVFEDNGHQYLSRSWMIDPIETQERAISSGKKEPWNKEFYVSFGHHEFRHWDDALKYGFVSGGGKPWYSRTLGMLNEGDRVWANIPKTGYVGVGIVTGIMTRLDQYEFNTEQGEKTLVELATQGDYSSQPGASDDEAEYVVPVKWLHTLPVHQAFSEVGLFGNQNTVCKPITPKWNHTVQRLKEQWSVSEIISR